MNYIYCYKNKINGHKYVGQTNNLKARYNAHKSQSLNPNSKDYNCLFHKKLRQYGLNNFDFYVLEEIAEDDPDFIDYRESFWIEEEKSWSRYGQGYNETTGGKQYKKSLSLKDEDINNIQQKLKNTNESFTDLAIEYNTYRECISRINTGIYGFNPNILYPIRISRDWKQIPQEVKQEIAQLLLTTKIPYSELEKRYSISEHTLNKINNGESNLIGNYIYPLRKSNQRITEFQENQIKEMLQKREKIKDIAEKVGVSRDTVSRRKKKYNF